MNVLFVKNVISVEIALCIKTMLYEAKLIVSLKLIKLKVLSL